MTQPVVSVDRGHVRYMSPESQSCVGWHWNASKLQLEGKERKNRIAGKSGFFQVELKQRKVGWVERGLGM